MSISLENLLSQLGTPGHFQVIVFILLGLNYFPLVFNHVIMAFFGSMPDHQCYSRGVVDALAQDSVDEFGDVKLAYDLDNETVRGTSESCKATYSYIGGVNVTVTCPEDDTSVLIYKKPAGLSTIVSEVRLTFFLLLCITCTPISH